MLWRSDGCTPHRHGSVQADDNMQAEGNARAVKGHITGQVLVDQQPPLHCSMAQPCASLEDPRLTLR